MERNQNSNIRPFDVVNLCSGGSKNFESRRTAGRQCISPVVICRKSHNELYACYTGKGGFLREKNLSQQGDGRPSAPSPF